MNDTHAATGNGASEVLKPFISICGNRKTLFQPASMMGFRDENTNGPLKYKHLYNMIISTWPQFVTQWSTVKNAKSEAMPRAVLSNLYNPWLELMLRSFTNMNYATKRGDHVFRSIVLTGAGGCGKTHVAGLFTVAWWLVGMQNSIATLTSTTKDMIGQRIWPVISNYWLTATDCDRNELFHEQGTIGDKVDSQRIIRAVKGDDKHAITALAVAHGETQKAIHNLKGRHAPRMLLVIDEANGTPEAIFEVIPNMRKACKDLTVIIIGNPGSRFDPHGRALTPADGWGSINELSQIWRTKAVPEWQLDPGVALRFDGYASPNLKAGKTIYPYIYTCEDKAAAEATPGYVGTFNYWVMERGLHPPEGTACTVFTEQLYSRHLDDVPQHYIFETDAFDIAFFDPAFTSGGDSAWLHIARVGTVGGKLCIQLTEGFELPISPDLESYDVDYQLARRVMAECQTRGIKPYCFGLDATAIGRGVAAILAAEWSSNIICLQFGGSASDQPSAQNDGRPGKEVYNNKVTELWFAVRECLESGQIRGFSRDAMAQSCCRLYEMKGKRYQVESKSDMKSRMRRSPDEFDAICGLVHVARQNGLAIDGKINARAARDWSDRSSESSDVLGIGAPPESAAVDTDTGWADIQMDDSDFQVTFLDI